ncbi:MAG: hemolysin family protein [Verrucomicrobiales bacterium]|nr:hemolysin family protein [Verrucomicrobiales bacterium]
MTILNLPPFLADLSLSPVLALSGVLPQHPVLSALLLAALVFGNAFLVAAEVSLLRVHASQLEEESGENEDRSKLTLHLVSNIESYLAACQFGITFSTIVQGALGEPFLSAYLVPLLTGTGLSETVIRVISFFLSVIALSILHSVFAEQIPRAFGFRKTVQTAIACSGPVRLLYLFLMGPVWLIHGISRVLLRVFFRMEPVDSNQITHTADELRHLVEETGRAQEVTETEQEILKNALTLNELCVRDIITPRNDVIVLDVHRTFRENLELALESKHTRFPLVDGHLDNTLGLIHIKDLLREMQKDSSNLFAAKRDLIRVSEDLPLDELLKLFLSKRAHIALVVDEFGGSVGLVMLDDVLDQVVGEIYDEFDDEEEAGFNEIDEDTFEVQGWLPLHELSTHVGELVLEDPDVSTVGGYITSVLGRFPEVGETLRIEGFDAKIISADERSVGEIRFERGESLGSLEPTEQEPIDTTGSKKSEPAEKEKIT